MPLPVFSAVKSRFAPLLGLLLASMVYSPVVQADPGDLDATFGGDGIATYNFNQTGGGGGRATAVVTLPNGKILLAGPSSNNADFAVLRLDAKGALDPSFGKGGKAVYAVGESDDTPYAMAVDPQQRIVVAGAYRLGYDVRFCVIRLLADGRLDSSFGTGGRILFPATSEQRIAYDVAIDTKGRIVLSGNYASGNKEGYAVARLLPNGKFDSSFSGDGMRNLDLPGISGEARAVAIGPNNKIILVGGGITAEYRVPLFGVVRLKEDGSLDKSFDGDGIAHAPDAVLNARAFAVKVDASNRILVAGRANSNFCVARLTASGALDTSFNSDGKNIIPLATATSYNVSQANDMVLDAKQRIILTGTGDQGFALARVLPNGRLDTSFDNDGMASFAVSPYFAGALAAAVDARNGIVVVGGRNTGHTSDFAAIRLLENGSQDRGFARNGLASYFFASSDNAIGMRKLADGKILMAGTVSSGDDSEFGLACFNADGSVDKSFGQSGQVLVPLDASTEQAFSMTVDAQNRILIAGTSNTPKLGTPIVVVRLLPNGSLDKTFDGDGIRQLDEPEKLRDVYVVKIDRTNKIVLGGVGGSTGFTVLRMNPNGSLDTSFGNGGWVTSRAKLTGGVRNLVIDSSNRIVTVGDKPNSLAGFKVARLNANGSIDTSFGTGGSRGVAPGEYAEPQSVVLDKDGKIVIAATLGSGSSGGLITRLTRSGANDTTFSGDGKCYVHFGGGYSTLNALVIRSDGRIVAAGWSGATWAKTEMAVVMVRPSGNLDGSFGQDGIAYADVKGVPSPYIGMSLYDDGRILVSSTTSAGVDTSEDFLAARFIGPALGAAQKSPLEPSAVWQ